ncbi:MAG TPA: hypothetical protein VH309_07965 [Elusimicrobiota bacterium]|nr:hypothetical protein [Elusimicrobiota bacterium]
MRFLLLALLALVPASRAAADWTGPEFRFDPRARSWSRSGGEPADHNLFDPDDNLVARFEHGRLKLLFDNFPDAGPRAKPDRVYAFDDAAAAGRLARALGRPAAPVDLLISAEAPPAGATAAPAAGLVEQTFADGVWTNVRREGTFDVTQDQFLAAGSPGDRALVERYEIKNVSGAPLKLKARAVLWAVMESGVVDYWHDYRPSWTAAESWDAGLGAAVAHSADGSLWLVSGVIAGQPEPAWTPETPPGTGASAVVWGTELALSSGEVRALTLVVAVGTARDEAARSYARLAAAGPDAAEGLIRAAWHRRIWERGVFATGNASLDSLNYLKYILNGNYAAENGGFTAAKYGHPEIWARDSGYTSLSSAYFEPERTRQTLETAIQSGYVAGQDGTSMLVVASEHYARWTGDRDFAKANAPALAKSMQGLWDGRNRDGFLVDRGGGLDTWRDMPVEQAKLKGKPNMYQQVLFSAALDRLGRLLAEAGKPEEAALWARRSREVAAALNRPVDEGGFWLPGAGFYADYIDPSDKEGERHYDEVGHSLGVLWDVFPGERSASVMAQAALRLRSANGLGHANIQPYGPKPNFNDGEIWPFANFLESGAQLVAGRGGDFMSLIDGMSKTMGIIPGALTEALPPAEESGGVNPVSTSWNSAGLYVLTRFLFGVAGDGFRRRLTLSPRVPDQLRGSVLSLTELPFSDWLVSITYRLVQGGRVSVVLDARRQGRPSEKLERRFVIDKGASRTVQLP